MVVGHEKLLAWDNLSCHNLGENRKRYTDKYMLRHRLFIAVVIAETTGLLCYLLNPWITDQAIDFMWSVQAARDILANVDPYHRPFHQHFIPYPLTAAILAFPVAWLPLRLACAVFFGASSGLLAFGLTKDKQWWRLLVFASAPYYMAIKSIQWSPLLFATLLLPILMPVTLCKPTVGLVVAVQRMTRNRLIACIIFGLLSLIIMPDWPLRWLPQTRAYGGFIPLFVLPLGPLLLLATMRWHTEQARHLLLLACIPQQRYLYDTLLLWYIPQTPLSMLGLTALSWFAIKAVYLVRDWDSASQFAVILLYLPALMMVLLLPKKRLQT